MAFMSKKWTHIFKRYHREDDGVAAVEFALVAWPFFLLLFGMIEVSLYYATGFVVEGAANASARIIRTGQASDSGNPVAAFEDKICEHSQLILNCDDLQYEVLEIGENFSDANLEPDIDEDGELVTGGVSVGGSDDVVLIRVGYRYEFKTPLIGRMLGDTTGTNSQLHVATVIVRNEPFEFEGI